MKEEGDCDTCDNATVCPLKSDGCHGWFYTPKPKPHSEWEELRQAIKEDQP